MGDAVVTYLEPDGESAHLRFEAPRSLPIQRAGRLSQAERQRYSRGNRRSK